MSEHAKNIEAVLMSEARPLSRNELARLLHVTPAEIESALAELADALAGHGLVLVRNNQEVALSSSPETSSVVEAARKSNFDRELSRAAAETLALILYRPGISKSEIEFVRGVNASYALRLLHMRGLIEEGKRPGDARVSVFNPSTETLLHFGVAQAAAMPDYEAIASELAQLLDRGAKHTPETP